jgi:DNA anti-recombination protein RmuC
MSVDSDRPDLADRPVTELDRIRDIIFGQQMQTYQGQFDRVAGQLALLGEQLDELRAVLSQEKVDRQSRSEELERTLSERLDQLAEELRSSFTQALDDLKDDKASRLDVGDILVEMGTRLKQQFVVADLVGHIDGPAGNDPSG